MALVHRCDRCYRISDMGDVDDPPPDWKVLTMPVRGSMGARSYTEMLLCDTCDDSLYDWLHTDSWIDPKNRK